MKNLTLLLALIFVTQQMSAQLTTQQWRDDLQFLKQTVHSKYPNLFHKVTAEQFDAAVDALEKRLPNLKDYETVAEMSKIVAMFRIGHTQLSLTPRLRHVAATQPAQTPFSLVPVQFYLFSDGLYIKSADKKYADAVGGKVLKIGNMETAKALEAIKPYTVYENEKGFESNVPFYLAIPELLKTAGIGASLENIPLVISKNGKEQNVVFEKTTPDQTRFSMTGLTTAKDWIDAKDPSVNPLWQREPTEYRMMEFLKDSKTLYVRHSVTLNDGDKTIEKFFKSVLDFIDKNDVEKLILDVRMNGGGNNYLNKPIITNIIAARKINQKGKFFCIIGRRTFSACQNLVNELEKYTEVTFVGEPTSENVNFYGDTKTETLPNSQMDISLSWMWWQNMDARDKRMATQPQLAVDMSFTDYKNGIDPVMNVINTSKDLVNIETELRKLVEQGKFDETVSMAKVYLKDPLHRYFIDELETKINDYGYLLINQKQYDVANKILKMNIELFPESANAYDSYAETFMHLNKKVEAIKYYEMAIAKDKEGITAENAKKMISRMKE